MAETVAEVVDVGLCTGCGTCLVACPADAIRMTETPPGLLQATVSEACTGCGKCRQVCPGRAVDFALGPDVDPFVGEVRGVFVGHAVEAAVRSGAQSGGVVSALLLDLLAAGTSAAALTTSLSFDGRMRPVAALARTREAVLQARGSKYGPVATNAELRRLAAGERVAVVGVSCQLHGLHQLTRYSSAWAERVDCTIGLFCDRTLLHLANEVLVGDAGLDPQSVVALEPRSTARWGWPGEVCFHLRTGGPRFYPSALRTRIKEFVTPPRCRLCFDKLNIIADLSVGDPWGVAESSEGQSVVLARTERGLALLNAATAKGLLRLRQIDLANVLDGQGVQQRSRSFAAYSAAWARMGRPVPDFAGLGAFGSVPLDATAMDGYRKQLEFNCRVAETPTRESALAIIRRHRRWLLAKGKVGRLVPTRRHDSSAETGKPRRV